jgi:hypothetical protein
MSSTLQEKRENTKMMWFGPPESGPAIFTDADCFVLDTCVAVAIHCYYIKSIKKRLIPAFTRLIHRFSKRKKRA